MATTDIHAIKSTPDQALDYQMKDKIVPYEDGMEINEEADYDFMEQDGQKYVVYKTLNSFLDCDRKDPYSSFEEKMNKWQNVRYSNNGTRAKDGKEPLAWSLIQSFNGWEVSPAVANEIGCKLAAELFPGHTVVVSTHTNTGSVHNHFMISAWDDEGRKWNDCHETKRWIRKISDRLCEEYGLNVLSHTKNMNLVKYIGKDGKVRYYEPTDRKNELINIRKDGVGTPDDVNSYRNTRQHSAGEKKKDSNRAEIRADIDKLLPSCSSYEELLARLRDLGYEIRDKKKDGGWMAHISFKAPLHGRATREDNLSDDGFYLRENLTRCIAEQVKVRGSRVDEPKHSERYAYGVTKLEEISDIYRTVQHKDGSCHVEERTPTERKIIFDIREKDQKLRSMLAGVEHMKRLLAQQEQQRAAGKPYLTATREQRLVAEIQSSFRCLQYMEQNRVFDYSQAIALFSEHKEKYNAALATFAANEKTIAELKEVLSLPKKLSDLQRRIDEGRGDVSYVLASLAADERTAAAYREKITRCGIDTAEGLNSLKERVAAFESRQNTLRTDMAAATHQMAELENCVRTYDRIDRSHGERNEKAMREFEALARDQGSRAKKTKEKELDQ